MNTKLEIQTRLVNLLVERDGDLPYGTRKRLAAEYNISHNTLKQWIVDIRYGPRTNERDWSVIIVKLLGSVCADCGSHDRLRIHHIIPLADGGLHEFENLRLLCRACHTRAHWIINNTPEIVTRDASDRIMKVHKIYR